MQKSPTFRTIKSALFVEKCLRVLKENTVLSNVPKKQGSNR